MLTSRFSDELIEATLIFAVFFLPGYLLQRAGFSYASLFDPGYVSGYLISVIPQVLLIVYLLLKRGKNELYGLNRIRLKDMYAGILILLLLLVFAIIASKFSTPIEYTPTRLGISLVALLLLGSIATGYREELFFRSMFFNATHTQGVPVHTSIAIVSLIFALGHIYQGAIAFIGTLGMAVMLQWHFYRYRNVHVIACAHGLYNFIILISRSIGASSVVP